MTCSIFLSKLDISNSSQELLHDEPRFVIKIRDINLQSLVAASIPGQAFFWEILHMPPHEEVAMYIV